MCEQHDGANHGGHGQHQAGQRSFHILCPNP
jgi:hypothetical protein